MGKDGQGARAVDQIAAKDGPSDLAAIDPDACARVCRFIEANLPAGPVPSLPEICLHRAKPNSGLWRLAERDDHFATPYWAYLWGGGLALARYILDHPALAAGLGILDLGCGSGLVGIAAAKSGAERVLAADIDPYAIAAAGLNAALNGVRLRTIAADLTAASPPAVDLVLIGDLFYEQCLAEKVSMFVDRCLDSKIAVLIGDPGRAFLPRDRLQLLAQYPGLDFAEAQRLEGTRNAVYAPLPST